MLLDDAISEIRNGPQGPHIGAFFDFDGTVVHGFSGFPLYRQLWRPRTARTAELTRTMLAGIRGGKTEAQFESFMDLALHSFKGRTEAELEDIGQKVFEKRIAGHLYPEAWRLVQAHLEAGHTVVIASSATRFQIEPAARALGVTNVLFTPLEAVDGVLTGRVAGKTLWRSGKAAAVRRFADANGLDMTQSYAYSNGGEDVEFLAAVGHPVAVNPDRQLSKQAEARQWPVLRFAPRGLGNVARTAAGFGGFFGGALVGAGIAAFGGDRRHGLDRMAQLVGDLTLGGAGVRLRVIGEHNARSPRPAVFVFNHQSQFDVPIVAKVLRSGFTGIAKQELTESPVIGPILKFAGTTFIDRANSEKAREALAPVVDTLRSGVSVAIAPEGTRSYTPSVGPFKKGAFHIAMQAGVPIIPIVIRNAGEVFWRNAATVRPGTVDVAVLDPIDVSGWDPADIDAQAAQLRQRYQDMILNWPTG
ncbi:HAD-IB family hydrolase [Skermania sp. ID1734]|uniref:HAD-IB family hydrolase n=1 Tax=Skermania sp. ID1734 TaxID=2597516 RepID=UPI00118082BC|nr:HAD-IB family hydrolase [Skermania sp. ID1734]TSD96596.1 HAD-IB family hydrolase [Skermania sp. ID1734]